MTPETSCCGAQSALRYAIVGMGGFAGDHHEAMLALEKRGLTRLIATCDITPERFSAQAQRWRLQQRGVRVYTTYEAMLAEHAHELDALTLATPIPLHAPMHELAVRHGVPVYLEKPPTLNPRELEAMIAQDAGAARETLVGFNFIAEEMRIALKQRLVDGEFGKVLAVTLNGKRSRNSDYFCRNNWAGRLSDSNGHLILDSCFGNSAAHYVHNVLFWAGADDVYAWAEPLDVRAQLYRAYPIDGADTFFVSATTAQGVDIRIGMTHACRDINLMQETVLTERAKITCVIGSHYEITWHDGRSEHIPLPPQALQHLVENTYLAHRRYLLGESPRPSTRLADCRPFVHLNALSYIASGTIHTFAPERIRHIAQGTATQRDVEGLSEAIDDFTQKGQWPDFGKADNCEASAANANTLGTLEAVIHRIEAQSCETAAR